MNSKRIALLTALMLAVLNFNAPAQSTTSAFSSETFDLGVVVSDVKKSVQFYTEAIGFKEIKGFTVNDAWTKKAGLTDGKTLDIHVLVLGDSKTATKLKLMEIPNTKSAAGKNRYVHSQLGFRYITLFVNDIDQALERLKRAGVKPDSQGGAVQLPEGFPQDMALILVRDPDGNMVELVGPRKK